MWTRPISFILELVTCTCENVVARLITAECSVQNSKISLDTFYMDDMKLLTRTQHCIVSLNEDVTCTLLLPTK